MTVTAQQIRAKLNASTTAVPEVDIELALSVARTLISQYLGDSDGDVPPDVLDRAWVLVTLEQINQDDAPNGIVNQAFDTGTGDVSSTPIRIGRDPMKPAYPILAPWVSGKFFCA